MKPIYTPAFFETLVSNSAELISVIDQEGVYKYVSCSVREILGYAAEELTGQNCFNFIHPDDVGQVSAALQGVSDRHSVQLPLFRFRNSRGAWRWIECCITNLLHNEAVQGVSTHSRDVTESVEARNHYLESQAYYHALYYNHPDSVFTLNREGYIVQLNSNLSDRSGYTANELLGAKFLDFVHPDYFSFANESFAIALQGRSHVSEFVVVTKEGAELIVCLTIVPVLFNNAVVGIQCIVKDITNEKKSEILIRKQAEQLNNIVESITDPFIVLDADWRYTYVNSTFASYLGKETSFFIGQQVWEFTPELCAPPFQQKCLTVAATRKPASFETVFSGISSEPITMLVSIFPFPGGVSVFFKDVSFEKDLQSEFEKLSLVVSKTTNGIVILNGEQKIEWINSGFTRMTGYYLSEVLQKKPGSFLRGPETDKGTASRIDRKLASGVAVAEELLVYRKSGEQIWIRLNTIPIQNEKREVVKFIVILTDITDRKRSEHKLLQLASDLYEQNMDLQEFTYIVSHNLRAPVANAMGLTNLLGKVNKTEPVFDEALQKLKISLSRLDTIISDINYILAIRDSAQLATKEEVNLQAVWKQVQDALQDKFNACGATVTADLPQDCVVITNQVFLYNILYSLLTNALKFRSEKRPLRISVRCRRYRNNGMAIAITDNGTGMDMNIVKNDIFTLYKRFHPHVEGKGIGLFLVKAQVEALGGRISVRSKPDAGTTFTIFI